MINEYEQLQGYQDFIDELTPLERGVYADMIMRSLRGSWRSPRLRTKILERVAGTGELEYYDSDELQGKVDGYFRNIGRGHPDGRYWRHTYEGADVDVTTLSEQQIRELARQIPDDMTWDDWRISNEFGDDE